MLKSPQHTFRIRHLLRGVSPSAVRHLARDPYVVFPSTVHFWRQMYDAYGLQRPHFKTLDEFVLENFAHMQQRLDEDRELVDESRWMELRYEDLVADPCARLQSVYTRLELGRLRAGPGRRWSNTPVVGTAPTSSRSFPTHCGRRSTIAGGATSSGMATRDGNDRLPPPASVGPMPATDTSRRTRRPRRWAAWIFSIRSRVCCKSPAAM